MNKNLTIFDNVVALCAESGILPYINLVEVGRKVNTGKYNATTLHRECLDQFLSEAEKCIKQK